MFKIHFCTTFLTNKLNKKLECLSKFLNLVAEKCEQSSEVNYVVLNGPAQLDF